MRMPCLLPAAQRAPPPPPTPPPPHATHGLERWTTALGEWAASLESNLANTNKRTAPPPPAL